MPAPNGRNLNEPVQESCVYCDAPGAFDYAMSTGRFVVYLCKNHRKMTRTRTPNQRLRFARQVSKVVANRIKGWPLENPFT